MPTIEDFLKNIRQIVARDDRGHLAKLRRGLSDTTQEQAWPLVVPWCSRFEDETNRKVWCTVGGAAALLFASNLGTEQYQSLGSVMQEIATGTDQQNGIKSYEAKFRRILNSPDTIDLCDLAVGIIYTAEKKSININCKTLFWDLLEWDDPDKREKIRVRWARDFYRISESETKEIVQTEDTQK